MKTRILILLSILFFMNKIHGQDSFSGKYQFAQHAFGAEYPRDNFKKFKGKIKIVNQSTMIFGDKVLEIFNTDQKLKLIFSKGIFYPNIFTSKKTTKAKSVKELKSMTTYEKLIYNSNRNDSISISDFQELEKLNPNPQTKRFVFWLYQKNSMNGH